MAKIKVQITIDEELLSRADAYADDHYTTRSGIVCQALQQMLDADEARLAVTRVADALQRIAASNTISEEDRRQLDAFSFLAANIGRRTNP